MALIVFFAIGVVEMFIVTSWTKIVAGSQVLMSGAITFVNVLIWYYVIQAIVSNAMSIPTVIMYSAGCALGTMVGTYFVARPNKRKSRTKIQEHERIAVIEHEPAPIV